MKIAAIVITILLYLGILGNLSRGHISPVVIVVALITSYFAWIHEFKKEK